MRHRHSSLRSDGTARLRRNKIEVRLSLSDGALRVLMHEADRRRLTVNQALGRAAEMMLRQGTLPALLDQFETEHGF